MSEKKVATTSIRVDPQLLDQVDGWAKGRRFSRAEAIRALIEQGLADVAGPNLEERIARIEQHLRLGARESGAKAQLSIVREGEAEYQLLDDHVMVPVLKLKAAAGGGSVMEGEEVAKTLAFDRRWIRNSLKANPKTLKLMNVAGDSMSGTLESDDLILFDTSQTRIQKDKVYIFREGDLLFVKRLVPDKDGTIQVKSDNPDQKRYPPRTVQGGEIEVIGRYVWLVGRRA